MISSFHAVFGLRQRDKSAKVIGCRDEVIGPREIPTLIRNPPCFLLRVLLAQQKFLGAVTYM